MKHRIKGVTRLLAGATLVTVVLFALPAMVSASGPGFPLRPGFTPSCARVAIAPGVLANKVTSIGTTTYTPTGPSLTTGKYSDTQSAVNAGLPGTGHLVTQGYFAVGPVVRPPNGCYNPIVPTAAITASATWQFGYDLNLAANCFGATGGSWTYGAINVTFNVWQWGFATGTTQVATTTTTILTHSTSCSGGTGTIAYGSGTLTTPAGGLTVTAGPFAGVVGDNYAFQTWVTVDNLGYSNSGAGASALSGGDILVTAGIPTPGLVDVDCLCP